ncbi:succinate dehydrogenase, hydrophobic membrane anchor protein [Methylococcaceae bacterium WWC4]|nr:succinate dehydrogenase, hydrophobic membrane anchor protein [Methylococcaceae bacterium WWC4]
MDQSLRNGAADSAVKSHPVRHWLHQRLTALLLIPLTVWLLLWFDKLPHASHAETKAWLLQPLNGLAVSLWVLLTVYHAALGIQVVLEDYVSNPKLRRTAIGAVHAVFGILGLLALAAMAIIWTGN